MQSAIIVSQQVLVMFLMIGCGLFFNRRRLISESAAREFCSLLLNLALPCVIIQSFLRPMRPEYLSGFAMAIGIAFAMHLFAVVAAQLLIRPREDEGYRVERFSAVYSNCAFMAFPLLRATVGEDGVFYATAFVVFFILFQWVHGILVLGGSINPRKLLYNPCILSVAIGLLIFFTQCPIPAPLASAIGMLSAVNSPLSMVITGVFLAGLPLSGLRNIRLVTTAAIRLLVMPLAAIAVICALGMPNWIETGPVVCTSLVIGFACPTAVAAILLSAHLRKEVLYASEQIAMSTLFSLVTLPLVAGIAVAVF